MSLAAGELHAAVQGLGPPGAAPTWLDSGQGGRSLDHIAEANRLLGDKARQSNLTRPMTIAA